MFLRWTLAGVCLLAGCERETPMNLIRIVPAGAAPLQDRGSFELLLQQCESDLLRLLGAGAGKHPQLERYRMNSDTAWAAVGDFYASRLAPAWRRSDVPEQQAGYRMRLWHNDAMTGMQRLVVALLDEPAVGTESPQPFCMLVVAAEGS